MADKLDDLLASVQQHVKDRKSELKALETQVGALRCAYSDLHQEIDKAQAKLLEARNQLAESDNELARKREEAQKIANDILRSAHAKKEQVGASVKATLDGAAKDVFDAQTRLKGLEEAIAAKKIELQDATNKVNAKQSELGALQAAARRFADG